jgi:hypothetical protein
MFILLTGYKRSGKDTVAEMLQKLFDDAEIPAVRGSLADPIKQVASIISDMDTLTDDRETELSWGYTPREIWQWLGTEVFQYAICKRFPNFAKRVGRLLWCKLLARKYVASGINVIVSDCRFPHEVKYFKSLGAVVVRIDRQTIPWYKRIFLHESEKHIPKLPVDYVLKNAGNLEELYLQVQTMVELFKEGLGRGEYKADYEVLG